MAQIWDGTSGDRLYVTNPGGFSISTGQSFSACGWATSTTLAGKCLFCLSDNTGGGTQLSLTHRAASANLTWFGFGTAQLFPDIAIVDDGSPFFWAITVSGVAIGSATFYVFRPGTGWVSNTNTIALQNVSTISAISLGNNGTTSQSGVEPWVGRTFSVKAWLATLTQQEIYSEMASLMPVRLGNLYIAMPGIGLSTADAFRDLTGRAWTLNGTISYNDTHPGVTYGAGLTLLPSVTYLPSGSPDEAFQLSFVQADAFQVNAFVYIRPSADVTTQWSTSSGTSHFALIDEEVAEDTDYIFATSVSQTDEVRLPAMTSPQGDILVNYRVQGIVGSGKVTVSMYAGAALVKADTQRDADGNYTMTVTSADYASVSDWSDIRLRFVSG